METKDLNDAILYIKKNGIPLLSCFVCCGRISSPKEHTTNHVSDMFFPLTKMRNCGWGIKFKCPKCSKVLAEVVTRDISEWISK